MTKFFLPRAETCDLAIRAITSNYSKDSYEYKKLLPKIMEVRNQALFEINKFKFYES